MLDIGNTSQTLARLDDDEKGIISIDTPGGMQEMSIVNPTGRDLHSFLEIKTDYPHWFARMCEYGFEEGKDHQTILSDGDGFGKAATKTDHLMTIQMGKEISMLQRNDFALEILMI